MLNIMGIAYELVLTKKKYKKSDPGITEDFLVIIS